MVYVVLYEDNLLHSERVADGALPEAVTGIMTSLAISVSGPDAGGAGSSAVTTDTLPAAAAGRDDSQVPSTHIVGAPTLRISVTSSLN